LRCLPQVKLHAADDLFEEVRMIKSPAEIEAIRHACTVTEQAILDAYQSAKPGDREKDVALRIRTNVIRQGADSIRFCVLGAGPLSAQFHRVPGEERLLPGQLVRVDCGAYFGAYASDVARAAVVQTVSQTIKDTYSRYMDIQRATIRQMKPGTRACDVFSYCSQAFERAGIAFHSPHVGHGIGVGGGHDEPMLHPKSRRVLEPNMMFCVEPVIVDPKVGAYQVEDLVLVTDDEPQILTTVMDTSEICLIN
jgi:Xaa-Pro aminopeptidase